MPIEVMATPAVGVTPPTSVPGSGAARVVQDLESGFAKAIGAGESDARSWSEKRAEPGPVPGVLDSPASRGVLLLLPLERPARTLTGE